MREIVSRVLTETLGALRFRWQGLLFAWIICVFGWVGVSLIPDSYESRAVVYIDTASVLRPLLADLAVNTDVMSEVRMMTEVLLSRPQLERVAREAGLDKRARDDEELEALLEEVRKRIVISGEFPQNSYGEQNLFRIQFTDVDPKAVYDVVRSLLDFFVAQSLGQNKEDSDDAQKFLMDQIGKYEVRLAEAERELADFKKRNVGLMPSDDQDYYQRLQVALAELDSVTEEYNQVKRRRDTLQDQLDGEEPTFGLLGASRSSTGSAASENAQLNQLQTELAELLLKYTDKHPNVVSLRTRIQQLQSQEARRLATQDNRPSYTLDTDLVNMNSLDLNPVYQSLRISVSEADAELSELSEQIAAARSRVEFLRRMVDTMPEVEAQLARLNRDYEVNRTQHTALLKRLESARLSDEAEFRSEEVTFRVIEPPLPPLKPVGPSRKLFASVVLIAGLGLGGALAGFLNLINPVFNSVDALRRSLELPVLGALAVFPTESQRLAER
jgi:polysaccharide chain length determinant protein (PEP-CTERM system associated)